MLGIFDPPGNVGMDIPNHIMCPRFVDVACAEIIVLLQRIDNASRIHMRRPSQRKLDGADDAVYVVHDGIVPEANHCITLRLQKIRSFCIVFRLVQMLTSIQFNHKSLFNAHKIRYVVTDGMLPPETYTQLIITKDCPEFGFGGCGFFPQLSRLVITF